MTNFRYIYILGQFLDSVSSDCFLFSKILQPVKDKFVAGKLEKTGEGGRGGVGKKEGVYIVMKRG